MTLNDRVANLLRAEFVTVRTVRKRLSADAARSGMRQKGHPGILADLVRSAIDWLNANAPAVQALAAVSTLIVTGVLAWFTLRYVRLTSRLAKATEDSLAITMDTSEMERANALNHLIVVATRLKLLVDSCRAVRAAL
jgi:hypothetical protein